MALIKAVPKSDATNVFDLLQDVKAAIMEEPNRVNMNVVATVYRAFEGATYAQQMPKPGGGYAKRTVNLPVPSCGTVGCFAGWVQMLAGKDAARASRDWTQGAKAILGNDLNYLFRGTPDSPEARNDYDAGGFDNPLYEVFNWGAGDGIITMRPGTKKYAKAVCARIDRFVEANGGRDVLKARLLQK